MVSTIDFESVDSGSNPDTVANKKKKPSLCRDSSLAHKCFPKFLNIGWDYD